MSLGPDSTTPTETSAPHPRPKGAMDRKEPQATSSHVPISPVLALPPPPVGPLPLDPGSLDPTAGSSAAAIARSAASSMAFIFKRPPLRFFRPVKISTYGALQAMAEERGRPVSLKFVQSVVKKEGPWRFIFNHALPPFCFNTVIGLTLFTTYTAAENRILNLEPDLHPYLVPALAGGVAGAAQSFISAPLDNLRLLQVSQPASAGLGPSSSSSSKGVQFKGWIPLLKQVMLPLSLNTSSDLKDAERYKLWASRGTGMVGLSVVKDSIGFATFFMIFQIGRDWGRRLATTVDRSMHIFWTDSQGEQGFVGERGWTGRILQSCVIVLSGATAGWAYGIVAEPFEALRRVLWQARLDWASIHLNTYQNNHERKPTNKSSLKTSQHLHPHPHRHHPSSVNFKGTRLGHFWKTKRAKPASPGGSPQEPHTQKIQKAMIESDKPPSISSILKYKVQNRRQQVGLLRELVSGMTRPKIRLTDSSATNAMKSDAPQTLFHASRSHARSKLGSLKAPSRVTRFRSFVFSPYAVGFFVWAVCSGDLTA
ncbi:hypothetical protein PCANC_25609 [Puccinia coronata f. sp. avenae]|uniref:Mitochondrial carrier protein n=1 Tax=Puccinia coronata f. sp. avenae TaxID=200324 RepID=A0A2N5UTU8_9BASI|nr:hypothetical protein PCANC_25609 [Puccinia coronata f. sp. avenae]PLW41179.1 hypothetical protein PCASD_10138 [Puccinia coronata f. sp. avenae]